MLSHRYRVLAAIFLLAGASFAHAEAVVAGAGANTCAQFGQDYKKSPATNEEIYYNWALGFLSGMNAIAIINGTLKRDLQAMSPADEKQFLRTYCDEHPLELFMDAALELAPSLPPMRGPGR
jgi:hypothetical protein